MRVVGSGKQQRQLEVIKEQVAEWCSYMTNSHLNLVDTQVSYGSFLKAQVNYPMPCLMAEPEDLIKIWRPVIHILLHSYGASTRFPVPLSFGGARFFGIGLDDIVVMQGAAQLRFFMGHMNQCDRTSKLMKISKDALELQLDLGKCPLGSPGINGKINDYVAASWIGCLGKFLHRVGGQIKVRGERVVKVQRENDMFLMQIAKDGRFRLR